MVLGPAESSPIVPGRGLQSNGPSPSSNGRGPWALVQRSGALGMVQWSQAFGIGGACGNGPQGGGPADYLLKTDFSVWMLMNIVDGVVVPFPAGLNSFTLHLPDSADAFRDGVNTTGTAAVVPV